MVLLWTMSLPFIKCGANQSHITNINITLLVKVINSSVNTHSCTSEAAHIFLLLCDCENYLACRTCFCTLDLVYKNHPSLSECHHTVCGTYYTLKWAHGEDRCTLCSDHTLFSRVCVKMDIQVCVFACVHSHCDDDGPKLQMKSIQ